MSNQRNLKAVHDVSAPLNSSQPNPSQPLVYQIRLQGHLGHQWAEWFGGLVVTLDENGDTLLTGPIVDQAALHGVLKKVRDLGMPLLSLKGVDTMNVDTKDVEPSVLNKYDYSKKENHDE